MPGRRGALRRDRQWDLFRCVEVRPAGRTNEVKSRWILNEPRPALPEQETGAFHHALETAARAVKRHRCAAVDDAVGPLAIGGVQVTASSQVAQWVGFIGSLSQESSATHAVSFAESIGFAAVRAAVRP